MAAVDRGYAWCVLVASCVLQLFGIGFSIGSVGVMLVSFSTAFPTAGLAQTAWIGSLRSLQFLASPVAVLLLKRFGCRTTTIVGALVSATGIALSASSTEVWHAYLTFGVLGGVGVALTYTCSTAVLGDYFDKKKHVAFPVSCLGNSLGVLIFPYLLQLIVDSVGHAGALYLLAALKAVEVACGLVFKPNDPVSGNLSAESNAAALVATETGCSSAGTGCATLLDSSPAHSSFLAEKDSSDTRPGCITMATIPLGAACSGPESALASKLPAYASDSNCGASEDASGSASAISGIGNHKNGALKRMLCLLRDWQCLTLMVHAFAWGFTVAAAEVLAPISAKNRGIGESDASLGMTILGAGMLFSSFVMLGLGWCTYDRFAVYFPTCGLMGICSILFSVCYQSPAYIAVCCLYGVAFGVLLSLFLSLLADFKSPDDYADLFGLYVFFNGIGGLAGPAVTGALQAAVSDGAGWYVAGCVGVVGSALLIPAYVTQRGRPTA